MIIEEYACYRFLVKNTCSSKICVLFKSETCVIPVQIKQFYWGNPSTKNLSVSILTYNLMWWSHEAIQILCKDACYVHVEIDMGSWTWHTLLAIKQKSFHGILTSFSLPRKKIENNFFFVYHQGITIIQ